MTCKLCGEPRKLRPDRPGKYFTVCETHFAEYRRRKNIESYARHAERRRQDKRDDRVARPEVLREQKHRSSRRGAVRRRKADYMRRYGPEWIKNNPERRRAIERRYVASHRDYTREKNRQRAARRRGAAGKTTYVKTKARWEFYGGLCYMCGAPADTIDHVIPLARGGTEWPANLRPACRSCNSSKGSR